MTNNTVTPQQIEELLQQNAKLNATLPELTAQMHILTSHVEELQELLKHQVHKNKKLKLRIKDLEAKVQNTKSDEKELREKIDDLPRVFPTIVKIADRTYHKTTYPACFVGTEAVDAIMQHLTISNRHEAIKICQLLMDKGYFQHVNVSSKKFHDKFVFYSFRTEVLETHCTPSPNELTDSSKSLRDSSFDDTDLSSSQLSNNTETLQPLCLSPPASFKPFFGKLVVTVAEVKNITSQARFSSLRMFVKLMIDGQKVKTHSKHRPKSEAITWNEELTFFIVHSNREIVIQLCKKHTGKPSTVKAELSIPLMQLPVAESFDQWFTFDSATKQEKPQIRLVIHYSFLNGTYDDGNSPVPEYWPLSWISGDPAVYRKQELSANHRCGIADIFTTLPADYMPPTNIEILQNLHNNAGTLQSSQRFLIDGVFEHGVISVPDNTVIELFIQKEPPHGSFVSYGVQRTVGGKVSFEFPLELLKKSGRYPIRMVMKGKHSEVAIGNVFVVDPGTKAVCFDIDGTLTPGDQEIIKQLALDTVNFSYNPMIRAAAVNMVRWWYAHGYLLVYLSGRQGSAYNLTREWLIKQGFPPGLIGHTQSHVPTMPVYKLGSESGGLGVGTFKLNFMQSLLDLGVSFEALYGNTMTDIHAYHKMPVPKEHTFIVGPFGGKEGTVEVGDNFVDHLKALETVKTSPVFFFHPPDWK